MRPSSCYVFFSGVSCCGISVSHANSNLGARIEARSVEPLLTSTNGICPSATDACQPHRGATAGRPSAGRTPGLARATSSHPLSTALRTAQARMTTANNAPLSDSSNNNSSSSRHRLHAQPLWPGRCPRAVGSTCGSPTPPSTTSGAARPWQPDCEGKALRRRQYLRHHRYQWHPWR